MTFAQSPAQSDEAFAALKDASLYLKGYMDAAVPNYMAEYVAQNPNASKSEAMQFAGRQVVSSLEASVVSCYEKDVPERFQKLCPYLDIQHAFLFMPSASDDFFKQPSKLNSKTKKWMQNHPWETGMVYKTMEQLTGNNSEDLINK